MFLLALYPLLFIIIDAAVSVVSIVVAVTFVICEAPVVQRRVFIGTAQLANYTGETPFLPE